MNDVETYIVICPLRAVGAGICWFFLAAQLIDGERSYTMLRRTLSYARYALSALASVGFALAPN
jgi:hypothetical protein